MKSLQRQEVVVADQGGDPCSLNGSLMKLRGQVMEIFPPMGLASKTCDLLTRVVHCGLPWGVLLGRSDGSAMSTRGNPPAWAAMGASEWS